MPALITVATSSHGPLTKYIGLNSGGTLDKSSPCQMWRGEAVMVAVDDAVTLARLIASLNASQALILGQIKDAREGEVKRVELKRSRGNGAISRSLDCLHFPAGASGWGLFDFDGPHNVEALEAVAPKLRHAAMVIRPSTSAGLVNVATDAPVPGSEGGHAYIAVTDAADIPRFLNVLALRLWLAGHGHIALSTVGSMLERCPIDTTVGSPERLVFEGPPTLGPGLRQERKTVPHDGAFIDTRAACPDLTEAEKAEVEALKTAAKAAIRPRAETAQKVWIDAEAPKIAQARGLPEEEVRKQLVSSFGGDLEGAFPLHFDDPALGQATVADVVKDPARFLNATLRDPMEPELQNEQCARLYRGTKDNRLFIKTFAHGGAFFFLKGEASSSGAGAGANEDAILKAYPLIWEGDPGVSAKVPELIEGMLPETGVALMSGQWGMLKTFTAIDLAVAVMTQGPFAGRATLKQGGVLFLAAEGSKYLGARLAGAKQEKAPTLKGERLPFVWIRSCPKLTSNDALAILTTIAKAADRKLQERFDLPLALILIDAMTSAGGFKDANDASEAQRVMDMLNELAEATAALVLAIDHFGKDLATGTRNSSAKEGGADAVLALIGERTTEGVVSNMRLAIRKSRDGETGVQVPFHGRSIELEAGGGTLVIDWEATDPAQPQTAKTKWSKSLIVFKRALDFTLADVGKRVRPFGMNGPEVLAADREAVRAEFFKTYLGDTPKAKKEGFLRCERDAAARGLIANRDLTIDGRPMTIFWLVSKDRPT